MQETRKSKFMPMEENPYESTTAMEQLPVRLRRGRRVLCIMAGLVAASLITEILCYNLFQGWADFPVQIFRTVIPLVLIFVIWTGRVWARYALGLYCLWVLYINLGLIQVLPAEFRNEHFSNVIGLLMFLICYSIVGVLAFFSSAITGLLNYREDQRELKSV